MPPAWVKPDWKDDDIFQLKPADIDVLKQRVAVIGKIKFRAGKQGGYGLPVSGAPALEEAPFKLKATEYLTLLNTNLDDRSPDWAAKVFLFCDGVSFCPPPSVRLLPPPPRAPSIPLASSTHHG